MTGKVAGEIGVQQGRWRQKAHGSKVSCVLYCTQPFGPSTG